MRERRTILVATHDPDRVAPLASGRLALRVSYLTDTATLARKDLRWSCGRATRCPRCCCS